MTTKVVILNWNGTEVLPRFLPSVVAGTPPSVEIVVADNGSTDGSVELLQRDFPSVRLVRLDRNYGFAEGYNRALNEVDADYYILLNSDVETPPGWCEPLIGMLENNPDVAAVAPKLLSWSERDKFEYAGASGGFVDALGYPFCRGRILNTVENDTGQYDDPREVLWATGACFACRADVFHELGGFDASFFAHQEEIDLCWRMWLSGHRVMVEPRSAVYHLGAGTLPPSPRKLYYNHRNNLAMLYKNLPGGWMRTVMAARWVLDLLSAIIYLLRGERDNFDAVRRARCDFKDMRRKNLREKRRLIQRSRTASPQGVWRGSIVLRYMFGRRRFAKLF